MNRYNIGQRIAKYREKQRMSTQELANRIKRSQATISRIENGKQGLTFELLTDIAFELKIHPFVLLSDEPLRHSVLLPVNDHKRDQGGMPDLLSNVFYSGRIRRNLPLQSAAELLNISQGELEMIELGLGRPDAELTERICGLYDLPMKEILFLVKMGDEAPSIGRRLAYIQRILSVAHTLVKNVEPGSERTTLDRLRTLLESADSEYAIPPAPPEEEWGTFLNRLSLHLVKALKNKEFREQVLDMVRVQSNKEMQNT